MPKRVLCLLSPGFEEIETVTPVDLLRRAGAEVVVLSITDELAVKGRSDITLLADGVLGEEDASKFDALFIPGGPGVAKLREDGRAARLAREFHESGKLVTAICAAPTVLQDADLLEGRKFTAHFSVRTELPAAMDDRVVVDGKIITSRGAGTALDFGLALVRALYGEDKAGEIAFAVMA